MPRAEHRRLVVAGGVLLALVGVWIGHALEYLRVWGGAGLRTMLVGSIHAYMLPCAVVIAGIGLLFAACLWRVWVALGRRIDRARLAIPALLGGRRVALPAEVQNRRPSFVAGIAAAWPAATLVQVGLYVLQENMEAAVAGAPAPGVGAIAGLHGVAPAIHAAVALVLVVAFASVLRLLHRRVHVVAAVEAVIRGLLRAFIGRSPVVAAPTVLVMARATPRRGLSRQRPPPTLLGAW